MKQPPKPYRNQRFSRPRQRRQQHLLEVSVRASKAREQRLRMVIGGCFRLFIFCAFIGGTWIGAKKALQVFFWDNPTFHLTDIRVETDGTLTREQILTTGGIVEGRHIFLTDLAAATSALDKLPQVERVDVLRTLPNRVDINITERRPIAWVAAAGDTDPASSERSFLIDARGYVMRSRKLLPEYLHLPVISGVETENIVAGQKVTTFETQAALELLRLNADSTRWQARNIDVSKGYCLIVNDRSRARVTFALDKIDAQLARLYRLLDHIQPANREIQTVNLFVERNTPVTFYEPEPEPPVEATIVPPASEPAKLPKIAEKVAPTPAPRSKPEVKPRSSTSSRITRTSTSESKKSTSKSKNSAASRKSHVDRVKKPFRQNG